MAQVIQLGGDLTRGACYTLEGKYTIVFGGGLVTFSIGETSGSATTILTIDTSTPGADFSQDFDYPLVAGDDFDSLFISGANSDISSVTNLSIKLQGACEITYCSDCYQLEACNDNFMLIQWTNDDNGLGFNYAQLGFIQQARVKGGVRVPSGVYEDELFYTTSNGQRGLLYTHAKEQKELWIQDIPDYLHSAIRIALAHDHFFIDGIEYVKTEGPYNPDYDVPRSLLAGVIVGIEIKTQDTFNQNC